MFGLIEVVDDPSGSGEHEGGRRLRRKRGERCDGCEGGLDEASLEESHGVHVFSWR